MALTAQHKLPAHHKKISGDHHRKSKHYLKTYHPFLPLLVLVVVGLAINTFWSSRTSVLGASTSMTETDLLQVTNTVRQQNNDDPLTLNSKLSAAAQAKANDMISKNYWSHTTPSGKSPWTFMQANGYDYYKAGENLAYGFRDSTDTIDGWLNSPEHRANLLSADYTDVGFGIAAAKQYQGHGPTTIIVAMYGEPSILPGTADTASSNTDIPADAPLRNVARIQLLTHGQAPWSLFVLSAVSLLAAGWFAWRHSKSLHQAWRFGEEYVVSHKYLDVFVVAIAVAGFILTRSAGFIH